MSSILEVTNATKHFGSTTALDGAGLELHKGEFLALLGPNGAGKTTLVRAISGRVRLERGGIRLLGSTIDADARRKLGVVPQDIAVYPLMTARENLECFGALEGLRGRLLKERTDWALDWTGLAERSGEPVKRFSGGMMRRLNIACGVLHRPEVILLDEPTVGVDPQSRQRIWEMLDQLRRDGASLLLTTHQLDEAQQVCDRIVIIDHGKVIARGTFDELVRQTIGTGRRITVRLEGEVPPGLESAGLEVEGKLVHRRVDDVGQELPDLLSQIASSGGHVADLSIDAPTLQAVFIHLTGRELRE